MSDDNETTEAGTIEVQVMDQDQLEAASKSKSFNNKITVRGKVKSAKQDKNLAKGGDLKGVPQLNLMIEVYADPDDAKSTIDDPVIWHRLPLPLVTEKGKTLSNKALATANFQLHAFNPEGVPLAKKGGTIDQTVVAFRKGQDYALEIWKDPKLVVGKSVTFEIELTTGTKANDETGEFPVFVNARRLRSELAEDESYTAFEDFFPADEE